MKNLDRNTKFLSRNESSVVNDVIVDLYRERLNDPDRYKYDGVVVHISLDDLCRAVFERAFGIQSMMNFIDEGHEKSRIRKYISWRRQDERAELMNKLGNDLFVRGVTKFYRVHFQSRRRRRLAAPGEIEKMFQGGGNGDGIIIAPLSHAIAKIWWAWAGEKQRSYRGGSNGYEAVVKNLHEQGLITEAQRDLMIDRSRGEVAVTDAAMNLLKWEFAGCPPNRV